MKINNDEFFVFDVESVGLQGEGFAVAGGIYHRDGTARDEFCFACPQENAQGSDSDREWVLKNIPLISVTHETPRAIRIQFWNHWLSARLQGIRMAADCLWPVEARFVIDCCTKDCNNPWDGPYPFVDIGSLLLANGSDPLGEFSRMENELPKHHPLMDARQSARILWLAIQ